MTLCVRFIPAELGLRECTKLRMKKLKLTIELVPASSWGNNLRSVLKPHMWKTIREEVYKKYNGKCAICKAKGKLHAHEVWEYDDDNHIQNLVGIIALCKLCHAIKHFGHTELEDAKGKIDKEKVIRHFMKVNSCSREDFMKHKIEVQKEFEKRSRHDWQLNINSKVDLH